MTDPRPLSVAVARRFMAKRHLLAPPRSLPGEPESVMRVVERLGSLQFDPLEVAGRNHDLILLARIEGYRREWTDRLLYEERRLFEAYNKQLSILPTAELPWYRIAWDREHRRHHAETFPEHAEVVEDLLERMRRDGPMSSLDIEAHAPIDWYWGPTNRARAVLEALAEAGMIGIARRAGNRRYYDLIERLFPPELLATRPGETAQLLHKLLSRHRGHGLLGDRGPAEVWAGLRPSPSPDGTGGADGPEPLAPSEHRRRLQALLVEQGALVPVVVEGVRGIRYVVAEDLPILDAAAREIAAEASGPDAARRPGVAFLAPLDPFVWDRDFLRALYGFDYVWEVYVPAAKRRWGYYVLPILFGDRLVGRIEPRIDRAAGVLRILGLWWEPDVDPVATPGLVEAFAAALDAHRRFGEVARIAFPTAVRHRRFVRAVRDALPPPPRVPRSATRASGRRGRPNEGRRTIEAQT